MSTPRFQDGHGDDLAELRQDINLFARQMRVGAGAFLLMAVPVGTAETPIRHGLASAPQACFVMTTAGVLTTVCQTQAADERLLYLKATSACVVNILVV